MDPPTPADSSRTRATRRAAAPAGATGAGLAARVAFFLSGAAGLVYEVCWIRRSSLVFGSTTEAMSTVLAVFFLGLAIGSEASGRLARVIRAPLRGYALLEATLALLALLSLPAFDLVERAYGHAYRAFGGHDLPLAAVRFALVTLVLLPPSVLMGGTLPLYCRAFVRERARVGRAVGGLYALNTLGAAAGTALAGFVLLPALGLRATVAAGAASSLVAAGIAAAIGRATAAGPEPERAPALPGAPVPAPDPPAPAHRPRLVLALFFLAGFTALAYEVLWARFLGLVVRNTVYTYSITLLVVLLGIVLGSALAARFSDRTARLALWFGAAQALSGLLVLALLRLPPAFWSALHGGPGVYVTLMLPAAALSGASFPLGIRLLVAEPGAAAAGVGRAAALNTLGGILGSLAAGFVLLPRAGLAASVAIAAAASLVAALIAWLGLARGRRAPRLALAAAAVIAALAIPIALRTRVPDDFLRARGELVAVREGRMGNLAVIRDGAKLELYIDGWWQGRDRPTQQIVAAHLPALLHPDPRRVLVVGVGAGQTPGRFLMHPVERVDCVDIEPAVFDVVRQRFPARWMADPRVHLVAADGRDVVAHSGERWDVIALEVGQVFRPGIPVFYTEDFYRRARARLAAGGVLSQFISLSSLPPGVFPRILASFVRVFPDAVLWSNTSEVLMIGFERGPVAIDRARLAARLAAAEVHRDLEWRPWGDARAALHHPEVLLGGFLCGPRGLAALAAGAAPYRDDRPELDYATVGVAAEQANEIPIVETLRRHLEPVSAYASPPVPADTARRIAAVRELNLGSIVCTALLRKIPTLGGMTGSDAEVALLERALAACPEDGAAHRLMGEARIGRGEVDASLAHYARAIEIDPLDAPAARDLGLILLRLDRAAEALPSLETAARLMPRDAGATHGRGVALAMLGRIGEARDQFARAVALAPGDPGARRDLERAEALLRATPPVPATAR